MTSEPTVGKTFLPTYPARPTNGGPFRRDKRGRDNLVYNPEHYTFSPKYNGWRMLIHLPTRTVFNRHGDLLSIADEFKEALDILCPTLDCEAFKWADVEGLERRHNIGQGTLILLDVIPAPYLLTTPASYEQRTSWVTPSIIPVHQLNTKPDENAVYQVQRFSAGELSHNWQLMQDINKDWGCEFYEGVVAVKRDSVYPMQLRSADEVTPTWIKHRWKWK